MSTSQAGYPQNNGTLNLRADPQAKFIAELAQQAAFPRVHPHGDGLPFVVIPDGHKVETLPLEMVPRRPKGTVELRDAASFIAYVQRYSGAQTLIYAQMDPARFVAVINEHAMDYSNTAGWRDWRANFTVPASREWETWTGSNRQQMGQLKFSEFVEDNLPDIVSPDGATMLEMALNFESSRNASFKSAQRLQDGSIDFSWVDEDKDAGKVRMPKEFLIEIPVFERSKSYPITARLKYRVPEGKLSLWYELVRPHKVLEAAFNETWGQISTQTARELLLGSPE